MYGHFYGNFTGNLAHAQSVCTRPFSRGEGPGDEANQTLFPAWGLGLGTRLSSLKSWIRHWDSNHDVAGLVGGANHKTGIAEASPFGPPPPGFWKFVQDGGAAGKERGDQVSPALF